jgi:uncharacterized repeat protein (TIGR03803 family)
MRPQKHFPRLFLMLTLSAISLLCGTAATAQTDSTLYSFTGGADGGNPLSSLVMDNAGNLYGTAVLYSFTGGLDGADPYYAGVIFDAAGNLYGTTVEGGTSNLGTVFELSPTGNGWTESVLYSFAGGKDGSEPYAGLAFDAAGNLYGTTSEGGSYSDGTVFELTPAGNGHWTESVIHTFNETNGAAPVGGLVLDAKGNVYGVTSGGGSSHAGVVFELVSSSAGKWTGTILYSFTDGSDGGYPYAERLAFDRSGNIYGTTQTGGASQLGTVFRLSRDSAGVWSEAVLYSFNGRVAANPFSGVILDGKGNLYGTCANGNGESTVGAVFELSPQGGGKWNERNLLLFTRQNGEFPEASLVGDASGNLYGTTLLGGASNMGVVFEVTP